MHTESVSQIILLFLSNMTTQNTTKMLSFQLEPHWNLCKLVTTNAGFTWLILVGRRMTSVMRIFEISNRIVTSVFDSKRAQLFEIFEYLPSPIFLLIYKFSINRLPAKIPVTGCTLQLPIYRIKHACAHAQHVFDLCRRSHQRQTAAVVPDGPHLCSGRRRGGDAYRQSKYMQRLRPAENEIASQWHRH